MRYTLSRKEREQDRSQPSSARETSLPKRPPYSRRLDVPRRLGELLSDRPLAELASRIGVQEMRRRLWHFFPGLLALAVTPIPHRDPIPLPVMALLMVLGIVLPAALALRHFSTMQRAPDENRFAAILGYGLPLLPVFLLFRGHLEIGLAAAGIVSFGDGTATLGGLLGGKTGLPWNRSKTWMGLACFFIAATLMSTLIYWLEAEPKVPLLTVLACIAPAVAVSGVVETLPWKGNDNLAVSATAALMMLAMQGLVIGW